MYLLDFKLSQRFFWFYFLYTFLMFLLSKIWWANKTDFILSSMKPSQNIYCWNIFNRNNFLSTAKSLILLSSNFPFLELVLYCISLCLKLVDDQEMNKLVMPSCSYLFIFHVCLWILCLINVFKANYLYMFGV